MLKISDQSGEDLAAEAAAVARSASLIYASDADAGIVRRRRGSTFRYVGANGRKISNPSVIARIRELAIPPAWTDVWISPAENGHIQATGRDAKGRKQYRYHALWAASRDEVKYASLVAFGNSLPAIRKRMQLDLALRGLPRERVLASVVWLLDNLMIRVGNMGYARQNKSFGLTTLRDRHVRIEGATVRFAFKGKSGKEWKLKVTDRRIAKIVKAAQDIPGQHLFQYMDEDGQRRSIHSQDVNAYLRAISGESFTSKHFRTWGGTVAAAVELSVLPLPPTKREMAIVLNAALDAVAGRLGNTRSVCRKCYVHPLVVNSWQAGTLGAEFSDIRKQLRRAQAGLERDEAVLLRWLAEKADAP